MTYYVIETNTARDDAATAIHTVKAHGPFKTVKEAAEWAALWIGYNPWTVYQQAETN